MTFNFYRINQSSKVSYQVLLYILLLLSSDILKVVLKDPDLGIHPDGEQDYSSLAPYDHLAWRHLNLHSILVSLPHTTVNSVARLMMISL